MAKRKKKMTAPTPVASRTAEKGKQPIQMTMMDYWTTGTNNNNNSSASRTGPSSSRDVPSTTPARRKTSVKSDASSTPVPRSTRRSHASSAPRPTRSTSSTSARKAQLIVISSSSGDDDGDVAIAPPSKRRRKMALPTSPVTSRAASEPPISTRSVTMAVVSSPNEAVHPDANNDTSRTSKILAFVATGDASSPVPFPDLQSRSRHIPSQMENSGSDLPTSAVSNVPEITHPSIFRFPSQRQERDNDGGDDDDDETRVPPPTLDEYDLDEIPSSQTQLLNPAHMPNLFPSGPPSSSSSFPYTTSSGVPSFPTMLTPRKEKLSHESLVSSSQTPESLRISDPVLFADAFGKSSSALGAFSGSQCSPSRVGSRDGSRLIALRQGRTHSSQPTFAVPFPVTPTRKAKLGHHDSRSHSVSLVLTPGRPAPLEGTAAASSSPPFRPSHTLDCEIEGITATLRSLNRDDAPPVPPSPVPSDSGSQTQSVPLPSFPSPLRGSQPRGEAGGEHCFLDEGSPTQDQVQLDLDAGSLTQDVEFPGTLLAATRFNGGRDRDQESLERENELFQPGNDGDGSPRRHEYRLATESLYEESLRFTHFFGLGRSPSRDVQRSGRGDHDQDLSPQFDHRDLPPRTPPSVQTRQRRSSEESMPSQIKTLLYSESYEASLDKYILETQAS